MSAYRSAHGKQFYGSFRHETFGSKDCSKIAKFLSKITYGHRLGEVDEDQLPDSDFLIKVITADESWVYGCDIETKTYSS